MALVLKRLYQGYFWLFNDISDTRAMRYPLMSSPFPTIGIITLWFYFIYKWGPKLMENRKPYNLKKVLIVYNVAQILVNSYIVYEGVKLFSQMNLHCTPVDYSEKGNKLLGLAYLYFTTKIADLFDTVFFVLKKNTRQISFLHVYHHFGMTFITWVAVKFIGGGHSFYLGFINSIIHCVMYMYYLLSAYDEKYKKSLWLKKTITQMQLLQFLALVLIYSYVLLIDCDYPKLVSYFVVSQNLFMIIMFGDFYIKTYILTKKKAKNE